MDIVCLLDQRIRLGRPQSFIAPFQTNVISPRVRDNRKIDFKPLVGNSLLRTLRKTNQPSTQFFVRRALDAAITICGKTRPTLARRSNALTIVSWDDIIFLAVGSKQCVRVWIFKGLKDDR